MTLVLLPIEISPGRAIVIPERHPPTTRDDVRVVLEGKHQIPDPAGRREAVVIDEEHDVRSRVGLPHESVTNGHEAALLFHHPANVRMFG